MTDRVVISPNLQLPDFAIRQLMRKHDVTIRALAQRFNLTIKRVREVRAQGVSGFAASEWHFMITGAWLD